MARHGWDLTPKEAVALQKRLADEVRQEPLAGPVETVAGVDCAFLDGGERILAGAVLLDARTMEVLNRAEEIRPCRFPYVPGLLSFREAPAVLAAVAALGERPSLVMVDGQGRAHPRRLGLASHVGIWLGIPTIGVAKSRLCGEHRPAGRRRGCRTQLRCDGEVVGSVLRTRSDVKPLYVSVGHAITLPEAVRWTLRAGRGVRLPEPTRRAHQHVSVRKREISGGAPHGGPGRPGRGAARGADG